MSPFKHPPVVETPADVVLEQILLEIMVKKEVLDEAKFRRDLICDIASAHEAARGFWHSGSIKHGTENSPLGDADCGVMINRSFSEFRTYGPDGDGLGPEPFIQSFAQFIEPLVREYYPSAEVNLEGNRAILFQFNAPIDIDSLGIVDPSVDLIVGLERRDGPGVWIPNRRENDWDPSHPQKHTELMTQHGEEAFRVARAHLIRLAKRAVNRDAGDGEPAICSWNLSALALELVEERGPITASLASYVIDAAHSIMEQLTDDPADVSGPIALPDGVTHQEAGNRLSRIAQIIARAAAAKSEDEARRILDPLFGVELKQIRERQLDEHPLADAIVSGDSRRISSTLGAKVAVKATSSGGGNWS